MVDSRRHTVGPIHIYNIKNTIKTHMITQIKVKLPIMQKNKIKLAYK